MMQRAIARVIEGGDLTESEATQVMIEIMTGIATEAQIGALLAGLRIKGETSTEIASFAGVMRHYAVKIHPDMPQTLVDTCGTGGDRAQTFNISTTAAFVAAGAGVYVVKHGNRGVSSRCGSADLLEHLGVHLTLSPEAVCSILHRLNIAFMYAPDHHPAMRTVSNARKEIGTRSVFNLLGPLTNPAGADAQLLGVYDAALTETIADVLRLLGTRRAIVVHGDGTDEITAGITKISELANGEIRNYSLDSGDFGIGRADLSLLKGGDPKDNAAIVRGVLNGTGGAARDVVLLNAGAAIYLGGKAASLAQGISAAEVSIDSGRACEKLDLLVEATRCAR